MTVADIRDQGLRDEEEVVAPFLGYLSACHTGSSEADSGALINKNIHLVNAMQLAGFRHVIGTLWEVSDPVCVEVAKTLYQTIREKGMTGKAVSLGLHRTSGKGIAERKLWD